MAGGGFSESQEEEISGINVTPLVDIMLVLLIIFMVTATFIANKALDLKLPEAESAVAMKPDEKTLNFALDKEGKLYLDGIPIAMDQVGVRIKEEREKKANVQLSAVINADATTPYALVIKVIDVIRKNEVIDFALSTDPSSSPPPQLGTGGEAAPAP
jgi:biopolymer transport protein TolR